MPGIVLLPDTDMAVRTWLRDRVTPRCYFGRPRNPTGPYLTLSRVGGSPDRDTPIDLPRMSVSAWGANAQETGRLARQVVYEARRLEDFAYTATWTDEQGDGHTAVLAGSLVVLGPLWEPEEDRNIARHITDLLLAIRPQA